MSKKQKTYADIPQSFRITAEEKQALSELAALHKTTDSKILRALLAVPSHYPKINSAIAQFV